MLGPSVATVSRSGSVARVSDGWWTATGTGSGDIVPDGAADLIWTPGRTPFVAGPDRAPRPSGLAAGHRVVGVRLRPGAAAAILGDGVDRATGLAVSLDQVWSPADVERLAHDLGQAADDRGRARALAGAVARFVPSDWHPDHTVLRAVDHIRSAAPADELGFDTDGLGGRQFRRRFSAAMGYGPAFFHRIVRVDRFVELLDRHAHRSLAELAAQAGYYDQAHLTRDVRQLLGTTPSQLRATG